MGASPISISAPSPVLCWNWSGARPTLARAARPTLARALSLPLTCTLYNAALRLGPPPGHPGRRLQSPSCGRGVGRRRVQARCGRRSRPRRRRARAVVPPHRRWRRRALLEPARRVRRSGYEAVSFAEEGGLWWRSQRSRAARVCRFARHERARGMRAGAFFSHAACPYAGPSLLGDGSSAHRVYSM